MEHGAAQSPDPPSLTRTDVLSTTEVAELLSPSRAPPCTTSPAAGTSPHGASDRRWLFLRERLAAATGHKTTKDPAMQGLPPAGATGLEPATSGVTGRRSNQLSYAPEWGGQYRKLEPPSRGPMAAP